MNALLWLNPYRWLLYGAAVAALLFGVHMLDLSRQAIGERRVQARWDAEKIAQSAAALAQSQANAKETVRRIDRQTEAQNARNQTIERVTADAVGADASGVGLRNDLAAITSGRTASDTATSTDGDAARATITLLAELLGGMEGNGRILAAALDRAHAAGLQCERSYKALTP